MGIRRRVGLGHGQDDRAVEEALDVIEAADGLPAEPGFHDLQDGGVLGGDDVLLALAHELGGESAGLFGAQQDIVDVIERRGRRRRWPVLRARWPSRR